MNDEVSRLIHMPASIEADMRRLALELNLAGDDLYRVALNHFIQRWRQDDGGKLIREDVMLYKLSKP